MSAWNYSGDNINIVYVAGAVVAISVLAVVVKKTRKREPVQYPRDTVMVHQFGKGSRGPSISPFVIKLETYLRMANIQYKPVYDRQMSTKGKIPWIEYNEDKIADSQLSIEYLNTKFDINLNSNLDSMELAIGRAFSKMAEENLYWYLVLQRSTYDKHNTIFREVGLNSFIIKILRWKASKASYYHGIGRHTETETTSIMEKDVKAISDFLGRKKFFMGDAPSEVDCVMFGQLSQFVWQMPGSQGEKCITEKYKNIEEYCVRMRDLYWPDWEECTLKKKKDSAST
ncbi:failed axon connections homolog [Gigantopelta aegis]|uniref:failed axon connections homolog n=1 Tax=Gigantopelta aegis TaxID=1735272 RepID=UPI001B88CDF6|nr:failed axon connections homolog [Gigantopelta aegis]